MPPECAMSLREFQCLIRTGEARSTHEDVMLTAHRVMTPNHASYLQQLGRHLDLRMRGLDPDTTAASRWSTDLATGPSPSQPAN